MPHDPWLAAKLKSLATGRSYERERDQQAKYDAAIDAWIAQQEQKRKRKKCSICPCGNLARRGRKFCRPCERRIRKGP